MQKKKKSKIIKTYLPWKFPLRLSWDRVECFLIFFSFLTTLGAKPFYCPDVLSRTRENQSINVSSSLEPTLTQIWPSPIMSNLSTVPGSKIEALWNPDAIQILHPRWAKSRSACVCQSDVDGTGMESGAAMAANRSKMVETGAHRK